jgi:hypothetical protein
MKIYGYKLNTTNEAIIFEIDPEAAEDTPRGVVGSSEWGWIEEDDARRICAALTFFSEVSTGVIERLAKEPIKVTLKKSDQPESKA